MGKRRSASRQLDPYRVAIAEQTARAKHELAMTMVAERVKTDAEFAAAVLELAGEGLREEIKKDALETVARSKANVEVDGHGTGALLDNPPELPPELAKHIKSV
jgi:hypothetical protein